MPNPSLDRRTLIRSAGVVGAGVVGVGAVAACGSDSDTGTSGASSSSSSSPATPGAAGASSTATPGAEAPAGLDVATSTVPVGGGVVVADAAVVVTQPAAGTFKAFSAICTHQGCPVTKVENGKILCPCHGSEFDITSGAPTAGPARQPLEAKTATVSGSNVVVS